MLPFIPFALPDIDEKEINEVVESMKSGWLTTGPKVKQFEKDFAEFLGEDLNAISVNSATAGLHLVLEALGIGCGDEVLVPSHTFTATAEVVRYLGADPVFIDVDRKTLNIDPALVDALLSQRQAGNRGMPKALILVHFAGLPCDMSSLMKTARKYGLHVIEDAAHALPATHGGRLVGTLGTDAVVYSFYATKTITTGEGGMVVTKDPQIADRCRMMRLHGISRDAFDRYTSKRPAWYYEVVAPGFKYNMTDIAASIGIQQLKKAWRFQQRRQQMAEYYSNELKDMPLDLPSSARDGDIHAWHLYVARLRSESGTSREHFIEAMMERGVGCSVHFIPLPLHPYWKSRYGYVEGAFANSVAEYRRSVSLPLYTKMTDDEVQRVVKTAREILT